MVVVSTQSSRTPRTHARAAGVRHAASLVEISSLSVAVSLGTAVGPSSLSRLLRGAARQLRL